MRSAVLRKQEKIENKPLVLRDSKAPVPSEGKVIIDVEGSGVCHSDLHIIEGDLPLPDEMFPLIPGHEVVGKVTKDTEKFRKGERVGIGWFGSACGKCKYCISGKENLCPYAKVTGLNLQGGYAEQVPAEESYVSRIPDNISSVEAAPLFCAGLTAFTSVKRIGMKPGDRVAVYGVGGLGYYAIQFIEKMGGEAVAVSRNHGDLADRVGASEVVRKPDGQYDGSIVFAPDSSITASAVKHTSSGGTIVVPAIMDRIDIPFQDFLWEKNLTSVASGFRPDTREMLDFVSRKGIKSMIETVSLEDVNDALIRLKNNRINGRVVLVP